MKIRLTENVGIDGKSHGIGEILDVPSEVCLGDARYLLGIKRAVEVKDGEQNEKKDNFEKMLSVAETIGIRKAKKLSAEELSGELTAFSARLMEMDFGELKKVASKLDIAVGDKSRDDLALEIADNIESVLDI